MRIRIQSALPVLGCLVAAAAGGQIYVSRQVQQNLHAVSTLCSHFLCDDFGLAGFAYDQQLKGDPASLASAVVILQELLLLDQGSPLRWADFGQALAQAGFIE